MAYFHTAPLAALASALVLAACGNGGDSAPAATETEPPRTVSQSPANSPAATPTPTAAEPVETPDYFADLPAPYNEADYNRGRRTFKLCQSCHTLPEGGPSLVGPNLYGMFGRQVGAVDGFAYSKAIQDADFVWTPEILDEWLASPRNFLPGNKMSFAGVRRPEDRLGVIAYIMLETGYTAE